MATTTDKTEKDPKDKTATAAAPDAAVKASDIDPALLAAAKKVQTASNTEFQKRIDRDIHPWKERLIGSGIASGIFAVAAGFYLVGKEPTVTTAFHNDEMAKAGQEVIDTKTTLNAQKDAITKERDEALKTRKLMQPYVHGRDVILGIDPRISGEHNQVLHTPTEWGGTLDSLEEAQRQVGRIGRASQDSNPSKAEVFYADNSWLKYDNQQRVILSIHHNHIPEINLHTPARQRAVAQGILFTAADSADPKWAMTRLVYRYDFQEAQAATQNSAALPEAVLIYQDIGADGLQAGVTGDMARVATFEVK